MKSTDVDLRPKASSARIIGARVVIRLSNGRQVSFPWARNPKLAAATAVDRAKIELICEGTGLHWPALDEDLSLRGVIAGRFGAHQPN